MKKTLRKLAAFFLVSAMAMSVGAFFTGCNTEPEHTTHYDVNADGVCDKCGVDMEGHTHIFSKKWSSDETNHWHGALCAHDTEKTDVAAHDFSGGKCKVCGALQSGLYHLEAEDAVLDDKDAPGNSTMVVEVNKVEFTESGKTDGALVSNVGYFGGGAQGQTITWTFSTDKALTGVEITVRLASAVGSWSDRKITEIDLNSEGAPVLTINGTTVSMEGKTLPGLDNLSQNDMQNGVAYHNFSDIVLTVDLVAGENVIVLTSGSQGCNVDKIMIKTDETITFEKTDNSGRPASH